MYRVGHLLCDQHHKESLILKSLAFLQMWWKAILREAFLQLCNSLNNSLTHSPPRAP